MTLFDKFPYSNAHELNLDWILEQIRNLEQPGDVSPEYVQQKMQIFNVKDFGAIGDGITDDTQAFLDAIAAVPEMGGVVFVPPGTYIISQTLILGNGTNTTVSDYNNIALIGSGGTLWAGIAIPNYYAGTILQWAGPATDCMIEVHGPINGCRISNLILNGNSALDYGMRIWCSQWGEYDRITIASCNVQGLGLEQWGGQDGSITSNNMLNRFSQISIFCPFTGNATCFYIGGDPDNLLNDSNMNTFDNIALFRHPAGNGLHIGFSDASSLRNLIVWCNGVSTTGIDVLLDGSEVSGFPSAWLFENMSATVVCQGTIGMITMLGYGMSDGESLPNDLVKCAGWTHDHYTFGTWVPAP